MLRVIGTPFSYQPGGIRETLSVFGIADITDHYGDIPGSRSESLSGDASEEELTFLRALTFKDKRPTPLYYYRELQSLRDPLHFRRGDKSCATR